MKARIDRAICNIEWGLAFPNVMVQHLPRTQLDHCPVLVNLDNNGNGGAASKRFFFKAAWFVHPNFMEWFKGNWDGDMT